MTDDIPNASHRTGPAVRLVRRVRPAWLDLPPTVLVLVGARAVNRLGAFTLPFLAVVLIQGLQASTSAAALVLALFGVATIPSRLAGGRLADRIGSKQTIVLGLAGCAVAQLGIALAHNLLAATVAALALGLAFELYEPPSQALIADVTSPAECPSAFGLLAATLAAAGVAAGLLATWLGSLDLRLLFVADAATSLACAALAQCRLPALPQATSDPGRAGGTSPWRDRRLLAMLASGTVFATIYLQVTIGLPLTLLARGLPAAQLGLLLTASATTIVLGQPLLRTPLLPRDPFTVMLVGYVVLAAGLAATGAATRLPGFVAATIVWSLGDLLLLGHPYSVVSGLAPADARGRYLAVYGISWGLAAVLAPFAGTQLLAAGGPEALWVTCALASLALAAAQPALRRSARAEPPP
ncbi:MAG: MFS transporter [Marmoricola sp.]